MSERFMWKWAIIIVLVGANALMAPGCAMYQKYFGSDADRTVDFFSRLQQASLEDLQAANMSAVDNRDTLAMACWPVLIQFVQSLKKDTKAIGPFSFYQRLRNIRRAAESGIPDEVRLGCAAMVQDSRDAVMEFMSKISSIAAMGGS